MEEIIVHPPRAYETGVCIRIIFTTLCHWQANVKMVPNSQWPQLMINPSFIHSHLIPRWRQQVSKKRWRQHSENNLRPRDLCMDT